MKSDFHGYYRPSSTEFQRIWTESNIVVDANVLLNLYAYSRHTSLEVLNLFGDFADRLWIPHQVALEYHENRCQVILNESKRYSEISKALEDVGNALRERKRHPYISTALAKRFEAIEVEIKNDLTTRMQKHRELIAEDEICNKITALFDDRVGPALNDADLEGLYKEGAIRYAKKIPPGYRDAKKPEPDRYGDLVLWHQIVEHATAKNAPVVFVTDDMKDDWWAIVGNERVGPRPELRNEFRRRANVDIYIYSTDAFVEQAKVRGKSVSDTTVEEIELATEERQKNELQTRAKQRTKLAHVQALEKRIQEMQRLSRLAKTPSLADLEEFWKRHQGIYDQLAKTPFLGLADLDPGEVTGQRKRRERFADEEPQREDE